MLLDARSIQLTDGTLHFLFPKDPALFSQKVPLMKILGKCEEAEINKVFSQAARLTITVIEAKPKSIDVVLNLPKNDLIHREI